MHGPEEILFRRLAHRVLLVVGQDDHIFSFIAKVFGEIGGHIPRIVNTAAQLSSLAKIVYAYKKRFSPTGAITVLESVVCGSSMSKMLRAGGRRRRRTIIAMVV